MNAIDYRHQPGGKCDRCRARGSIGKVWGCSLCPSCVSDWFSEKHFGPVEINKALGQSSDPEKWSTENGERYAVEAQKRTVEWVKKGMAF